MLVSIELSVPWKAVTPFFLIMQKLSSTYRFQILGLTSDALIADSSWKRSRNLQSMRHLLHLKFGNGMLMTASALLKRMELSAVICRYSDPKLLLNHTMPKCSCLFVFPCAQLLHLNIRLSFSANVKPFVLLISCFCLFVCLFFLHFAQNGCICYC